MHKNHDFIDPSAISGEHASSDLATIAQELESLSTQAKEIVDAWIAGSVPKMNTNRYAITWNNFLVPGGRLMFRAADLRAFHMSSRLQKVANQWTDSAVRNGGFSQYGNGLYPKRGDNWTCGRFAATLIETYIYKIEKRNVRRRTDLNMMQDCGFAFERISNLIIADRSIGE